MLRKCRLVEQMIRNASSGRLRNSATNSAFWNQNDSARRKCACAGRVTIIRSQGSFGEGVTGMKDMKNLRLARGVHAIDANSSALHNKETLAQGSPSRKRVSPLSRLMTLENELISGISGDRNPSKICERSREF